MVQNIRRSSSQTYSSQLNVYFSNIENKTKDGFSGRHCVISSPRFWQNIAFHIGKRNSSSCGALMKKSVFYKLIHIEPITRSLIGTQCQTTYSTRKHIIAKAKTTHIERRNRDFRTHLKDDTDNEIIKAYIFLRKKFDLFVKQSIHFKPVPFFKH
jgi:IS1 family transposase